MRKHMDWTLAAVLVAFCFSFFVIAVRGTRIEARLDALEAFTHFDDRPIYYQPLVDLETCAEQNRALREELSAYKAALEQARMDAENPRERRVK